MTELPVVWWTFWLFSGSLLYSGIWWFFRREARRADEWQRQAREAAQQRSSE